MSTIAEKMAAKKAEAAKAKSSKPKKETKPVPAAATAEAQKKTRRNPVLILDELKAKRARLDEDYAKGCAKLDARIADMTAKNAAKVAAAELIKAGTTVDDIDAQIAALREQRRAVKKLEGVVQADPAAESAAEATEAVEA